MPLATDNHNTLDNNAPRTLRSRSRVLVRNTLASASSNIFAQLLALITFPILIRQVGATDYGIFTLASSAVGYFSIVNLAARTSVVKYSAELSESDRESLAGFFSNAVLLNSLLGVLIAGVLVILALFCQDIFTIKASDVPRAKEILLINAAAVFLSQPLSVFGSLLYGFQQYGLVSLLGLVWTLSRSAVIVAMYYWNGSIFWLVWEEVLLQFLNFIVIALIVKRRYPFISVSLKRLNGASIKKIFSYGGWSVLYMVSFIMVYQGSIILTGIFVSLTTIVYLQIAYKLYNLINTASLYLTSAVVPSSSAAIAGGDDSYLSSLIISGPKINLSLVLPFTINILVFTPEIIGFWIGKNYVDPALNASRVLISSWLLLAPTAFLTQIYFGQKDIWKLALTALLGAFAHSLMVIFLGKFFHLTGIALACSLFYGFLAIAGFIITSKKLRLSPGVFFSKVIFPSFGASLVYAAFLGLILFYIGHPQSIAYLMIFFSASLVIGIFLTLFLSSRYECLLIFGHLKNDFLAAFGRVTRTITKKCGQSDISAP